MFCLILSVFHFKTNYYLYVAVTLVAAVLYWAAESCWCLHVVFRVRRINWTKYKLMKNDSYAETNCTFTHHKGAPALVVCVCSLTVLGCVVQRDDTKPSFVSLLEDPLSVWLAALLFMRTCVHACHTGAALWKHWVLLALAAGQRLPAILLLWNGPLFCWCCAGLWLKHEVETDYSNICRVQHDVYGLLVTRQARPSTLEYCLIFRLSLSAAADALSTACACFR